MSNKYIFICESCDWKKTCGIEESGLRELKSDAMSSRKFRCPGCGRAMTPRGAKDPQSDIDRKLDDEKNRKENNKWMHDAIQFQSNFLKETEDSGEH
jgi:hypothetical protein